MEILSAEQIHAWDEYTIAHEPVSSTDLMERAATKCFEWLKDNGHAKGPFSIFCAKGNNGGDGLALGRMLCENGSQVIVHILEFGHKGTADFQVNLARVHETTATVRFIQTEENFLDIPKKDIVIDALFGSGLNRPLQGVVANLVAHINGSGNTIISIDVPSGMSVDSSSKGNPMIRASHTLSFQCYKLAFLMAENSPFIGQVHLLDIGLLPEFLQDLQHYDVLTDQEMIAPLLKPRNPFANKGDFGHALLLSGSHGKMGAAVLASRACLKSGVGLLTVKVPACGYIIMQASVPEAMVLTDRDENILTDLPDDFSKYQAIGIGPGIGTDSRTKELVKNIYAHSKLPLVIDADALNILSADKKMLETVPPSSILTPHPKEFERLFGAAGDDFKRMASAIDNARTYRCVIVLKGHYTLIALPDGKTYFNSTGNAGMAKGGSGDVLTGIITALLAQGYPSVQAALLGVYLHGLAGDFAASLHSSYSMTSADIVDCLGRAYLSFQEF